MTNATQPLDAAELDRLEALARAATRGPWKRSDRPNGPFWHISSEYTIDGEPCKSGRQSIGSIHAESKRGAPKYAVMFEANASFVAEFNPATAIALIAQARSAAPASQADEDVTVLIGQIINIPAWKNDLQFDSAAERILYKEGHRDARHAAAELVNDAAAQARAAQPSTLTDAQIAAGAAVIGDDGKPIGRNTAIMVADAMARAAKPASAAIAAWMTEDGDRVVSAATKAGQERDSGASASAMRPYSVPLVRALNQGAADTTASEQPYMVDARVIAKHYASATLLKDQKDWPGAAMLHFSDNDHAEFAFEVLSVALTAGLATSARTDSRATLAPVAARPELTVWYGPMPESNGKSNFTATLKRKGASMFDTDSYTFQRSEYPDRVRYEADCMRYLIGEIAERPNILDYDADKHSGYVEPVAAQQAAAKAPAGQQGAWVAVKDQLPQVGELVLVYSPPTKHDYPDTVNIGFDCMDPDSDDGTWLSHNEHYEHWCCVAKPEGSIGPSADAPYTHWMPLPLPPEQSSTAGAAKGGNTFSNSPEFEGISGSDLAAKAPAAQAVDAIVRDVCELDYTGEFDEEKMLAVTVDDLRLICERHIATSPASTPEASQQAAAVAAPSEQMLADLDAVIGAVENNDTINARGIRDLYPVENARKAIECLRSAAATTSDDARPKFYVASRASIPERAAMWRALRAEGIDIVASWIDEAGEGETASFAELWARIEAEVRAADRLVLYVEPDDFPLKGAYIEAGMALAMGKPVVIVAPGVSLDGSSMRPLGSWAAHLLVSFASDVRAAMRATQQEGGE